MRLRAVLSLALGYLAINSVDSGNDLWALAWLSAIVLLLAPSALISQRAAVALFWLQILRLSQLTIWLLNPLAIMAWEGIGAWVIALAAAWLGILCLQKVTPFRIFLMLMSCFLPGLASFAVVQVALVICLWRLNPLPRIALTSEKTAERMGISRLAWGLPLAYLIIVVVWQGHHQSVSREVSHLYVFNIAFLQESARELFYPTGSDFLTAFNFKAFDSMGWSRPRFLSNLMMIFDTKFRFVLLKFFPLYPSVSVTWLATLILSPWLLYRFARRYFGSVEIGVLAVLLYSVSLGFLSGLTLRFHPGKPWVGIIFLLLMNLGQSWVEALQRHQRGKVYPWAILLLTSCGFFLDETGFFSVILLPCLFPSLLLNSSQRKFSYLFLASPVVALLLIEFVIPVFIARLGLGDFSFYSLGVASNDQLRELNLPLVSNWLTSVASHLIPFAGGRGGIVLEGVAWWQKAFGIAATFILSDLLRKQKSPRTRAVRLFLVAGLFSVFFSIIRSRWSVGQKSIYYYGAPFSLFFSVSVAALVLQGWKDRLTRSIFVFAVLAVCVVNFSEVTRTSGTLAGDWASTKMWWLWGRERVPTVEELALVPARYRPMVYELQLSKGIKFCPEEPLKGALTFCPVPDNKVKKIADSRVIHETRYPSR